jgi:BolA protein
MTIMSMEETIRRKLTESLAPTRLEVINESHLHAGHAGDNGTGESHFRVLVVSQKLAGLSRVAAQRVIYGVLAEEMSNGIHALSINVLAE